MKLILEASKRGDLLLAVVLAAAEMFCYCRISVAVKKNNAISLEETNRSEFRLVFSRLFAFKYSQFHVFRDFFS